MPEDNICKDCINWKQFGKSCFFYWEKKKQCPSKIIEDENSFTLDQEP